MEWIHETGLVNFDSEAVPSCVTNSESKMSWIKSLGCGCLLSGLIAINAVADENKPERTAARPGIQRRVPWTTSRMAGTPEPPPPYQVAAAFAQLKFSKPVVITSAPGTDRLFVAEQSGKIYSFPNDPACDTADLFADMKKIQSKISSVYGLTFHPDFQRNRYVYICYVAGNTADGSRVSRFQVTDADPPLVDPDSERLLITWPGGGHNGGCLKFGPDGYLYITTGDGVGPAPPDVKRSGQNVGNLLSAVLRIDVDHSGGDRSYTVPADNPLIEIDGARPEIWAYGFRNPWKMSFDRATGDLWVGDVGWQMWEMIYRVQKGGNYGWSIMEGRQPAVPEQEPGPTPILPPTIDHPHSEAASITGGFVYRGRRLPQLVGQYLYGDFQTGVVWAARMDGERVASRVELAQTPLQLVGFGESRSGELFLLDYRGSIYRLEPNPAPDRSREFPRRLSQTGLFASLAPLQPAPGVIEYSINSTHWADGSRSRRWLAVPPGGTVKIDGKGNWQFPDGSVIAKTIIIDGIGSSRKTVKLETQILHREQNSWRPYTYVWDSAERDASLADAQGFSRVLQVHDDQAPGGLRQQTWRFAGRKECSLCHNPWVEARTTIFGIQSASLLGVHVRQLNRVHEYDSHPADQLATLQHIGLLDADVPKLQQNNPAFVDPYDESADLDARARTYLHLNCAHCHQQHAGGAANIVLTHSAALKDTVMLGVRPTQGTFGIADARIVAPGDPSLSVLIYRVAKLGGGRMPRVGSAEVDSRGLRLLHDWIAGMPVPAPAAAKATHAALTEKIQADIQLVRQAGTRDAAVARLIASTRGALALSQIMDSLPVDSRRQVVERASKHSASQVRDLFERFVPADQRIKRLGSVVNQSEILSLEADAERGRKVFFSDAAASCKNCHRIQKQGENLGPDLSTIGKKYRRDQLLLHILEPSRFMEPKYVPYLVETKQGLVYSGLLEKKTDSEVVLKDARNKRTVIAAADVEVMVRQQKSLMPDLLLRDMTAAQVADLLAFLATLR